jgi:hypothetical protein
MALRHLVVQLFGEQVTQRIERFVDGRVFGDHFVTCPSCKRAISATLMSKWRMCPVCRTGRPAPCRGDRKAGRRSVAGPASCCH